MNNDKYKQYAEDLAQMVELDQKLRSGDVIDWDEVEKVDTKHTQRVKEMVENIGFLGISKVGKEGSHNAWLLVQHTPDSEFMKMYLQMMEEQDEGEYDKVNHAYLKDRVLLNDGKPQLYGTQLVNDKVTGKPVLYEVEDRENLNKRREEIGLETIEEYLRNFE